MDSIWLIDSPSFVYKGDNFCDFIFAFRQSISFWNGSILNGKNLLLFFFRIDPILKGGKNNFERELPPL